MQYVNCNQWNKKYLHFKNAGCIIHQKAKAPERFLLRLFCIHEGMNDLYGHHLNATLLHLKKYAMLIKFYLIKAQKRGIISENVRDVKTNVFAIETKRRRMNYEEKNSIRNDDSCSSCSNCI